MAKKKDNNLSAAENESANDAFSDFAAQINKAAGREVAYIPGRSEGQFIVSRFSSRILAVDVAIGGGYPRGRNIYLVGPKSSAKSTLLCLAIAEVNSSEDENDKAYLEDSENSFDRSYAYYLGVDPYKLMAVRSYTAEQALDFFRSATASGKFRALFLDSLSAIQPKKLVEGNNDDNVMGGIGRLTSINLSNLEKDKFMCNNNYGYMPTIFYTSQIRKKVGLVFGNPNVSSGGESPDFYASVRLDMNQGEQIIENDLVVGGKFTFVVTKNKTYPAYRRGEFIMMNDGNNPPYISNEATLMDMAVASGIIEKKGSWYSYLGSNLAQGAINTAKVIENFPTEEKNNMLDLCMSALHPNMKLAFRFKDDTRTTVREETVEKCQEES